MLRVLCIIYFIITFSFAESDGNVRKFPNGFLFGAATASYQVEGAWNEQGKSENIWDRLTHTDPCAVKGCSNGDIADDSYHLYQRDVEMMRELGLDFYRFSMSWTRLLPTSFPDKINQDGVAYYTSLINKLLKYNIMPVVTLYHWDLPQKLQDMGGWTNPYIVNWYADYAKTVFEIFGNKVKFWITINEPFAICHMGYGDDKFAPRLNISGRADYMCAKNLLLAHAKAYHIYNNEFRPSQGGFIGMTIDAQQYEPATENDIEAADDFQKFTWQQFAQPIFGIYGDFPQVMKNRIADKSIKQGFYRSRLPEFTPEEVEFVKGTSDFFGLNHYNTYYTYSNASVRGGCNAPSFEDDVDVALFRLPQWKIGESNFNTYAPFGFRNLLKTIREIYNNPPVYIFENGFATHGGLDDEDRVTYYKGYFAEVLNAIEEGSDIKAYTAWSLMDNFEWLQGYTERFGLYEVDYTDPARTRTPRKSAFVYKHILRTRTLDPRYEPQTNVMTIDEEY